MVNIHIDNKPCTAPAGSTIYAAAKSIGITIPTLCNVEGLTPSGACRICVVEVEGMPGLVPSCSFPVSEGMKIQTHSPRVLLSRKTIVELLLANHPDDCLYCIRNNGCQLQTLAADLGVRRRRYTGERSRYKEDVSSPSVIRDPEKCILCGKCVRVCEEVQQVSAIDFIGRGSAAHIGTAFDEGLNLSSCINCGQCILVCPTGALHEHDHLKGVIDALNDPGRMVVVQHAPSVSVTIGEEFGVPAGNDCDGIMVAALRRLGFNRIFDTSFSADLTIMEEGSELVHRIKTGGKLPMLTSCSPGWINFIEHFYPELLPHVSSCKSPQQMFGALAKTYYAEKMGIDAKKLYVVSVMPCTAKKWESGRPEMTSSGFQDVDAVLTTRELATMMKQVGIDLPNLPDEAYDAPLGISTGAAVIFGATGGVMEAALRTVYEVVTKKPLENVDINAVRGLEGVKEAEVDLDGLKVRAAVANGLANARKLMDKIVSGEANYHFIEIMACPGGCIGGGGQPIPTSMEIRKKRAEAIYKADRGLKIRKSHENPAVQQLYREFLGEPNSHKSHELLHTHYSAK